VPPTKTIGNAPQSDRGARNRHPGHRRPASKPPLARMERKH
jgi:hypothetical protein